MRWGRRNAQLLSGARMVTPKPVGASCWGTVPLLDLSTHYMTKKYKLLALVWHLLVVDHQTFECGQHHWCHFTCEETVVWRRAPKEPAVELWVQPRAPLLHSELQAALLSPSHGESYNCMRADLLRAQPLSQTLYLRGRWLATAKPTCFHPALDLLSGCVQGNLLETTFCMKALSQLLIVRRWCNPRSWRMPVCSKQSVRVHYGNTGF